MKGRVNMEPDPEWPRSPTIRGDTLGAEEITAWVTADIGAESKWSVELIAKLEEYAREGRSAGYLGMGNAHHIYVHKGHVLIECEYNDVSRVLLTTSQAVSAINRFHEFYRSDRRPVSFEVDYEAEGEDAVRRFLALADYDSLDDIQDGWD